MQQIPVSLLTLLAGVLVTLVSLWVGQHHGLLPVQASEQAPLVDDLFSTMVTIGTALFIVVQGTIVIFMWRFRKPKDDETDGVPLEGNLQLEIVWTAIPSIIVIGLGIYGTDVYQRMGGISPVGHDHSSSPIVRSSGGSAIAAPLPTAPAIPGDHSAMTMASADGVKPTKTPYGITGTGSKDSQAADLVVNVTGLQFAWIFNYPTQGITAGELHVPIGKAVQLNLAAQDVIHSFWVPQFRLKQDAIPGEHTELRFKATRIGEYPVVCAELCGSYHGAMRTRVIVHAPEDYDLWLKENTPVQEASSDINPDLNQAIALNPPNPQKASDAEFLAPYAQEMGVQVNTLVESVESHSVHPHSSAPNAL